MTRAGRAPVQTQQTIASSRALQALQMSTRRRQYTVIANQLLSESSTMQSEREVSLTVERGLPLVSVGCHVGRIIIDDWGR